MRKSPYIAILLFAVILTLFPAAFAKDPSCLMIDICGNGIDDDCENGADGTGCIAANQETPEIAFSEEIDDLVFFSTTAQESMDSHNTTLTNYTSSGGWGFPGQIFLKGTAEWDFTAPRIGYYVLSFAGFSDSTHVGAPAYKNTGDWITLPPMNQDRGPQTIILKDGRVWTNLWRQNLGHYHFLIYLDAGKHRFRVQNTSSSAYHLWKSWISPVRNYPFTKNAAEETHPKLFYNQADIARVTRNKTNGDPSWPLPDKYSAMCSGSPSQVCDNYLFWTRHDLSHVILKGIFDNRQNYIDCGVSRLIYFAKNHYECGELPEQRLDTDWGTYLTQLAIWYDWLYPYMSDAQREEVRLSLDYRGHEMFMMSMSDPIWSRFNWLPTYLEALGLAGLANEGSHKYVQIWTDEALKKIDQFYVEKNIADGFPTRPIGYYGEGITDELIKFLANYKKIKGTMNPKHEKILEESIISHIYALEPNRSTYPNFGNWGCNNDICRQNLWDTAYTAITATATRNPLAQWLYLYTFGKNRSTGYYEGTRFNFLSYDDSLQPASPNATLPKGKAFYNHGMIVMRSSFENKNDIQFIMRSGQRMEKSNADQGSFFLNAYGRYMVNEQTITNEGGCTQAGNLTVNHNTVVIDDQMQTYCDKTLTDKLAEIDSFINSEYADYANVDLSKAWGNAEKARRHVLYVRPNFFVLFDDYKKDSGSHNYDWILYPSKNSFSIQDTGNNNYKFEGGNEDLEILIAEPNSPNRISSSALKLRQNSTEGKFLALLYPTSTSQSISLPSTTKFNETQAAGFEIGGTQTILRNKTNGEITNHGITTDASLALTNPAEQMLAMFGGKKISYNSLQLESTIKTNAILKRNQENYIIWIGDESPRSNTGTTTLKISGIANGNYEYLKDNIAQTTITATNNTTSFPIELSKHILELRFISGDQCVDMETLMGYISQWKNGALTMITLMQKIKAWKTGC